MSRSMWLATCAMMVIGAAGLAGCGGSEPSAQAPAASSELPAGFFLASEPGGAAFVEEVKKGAKAGDEVVIRGRIGGSESPFVENRAVFTIVGPGIKSCLDMEEKDHCATPWDYCCESGEDIAAHSATIRVVDAGGAPVRASVKGKGGTKELSDVVVKGKVAQAQGAVLVIHATAMYVVKP